MEINRFKIGQFIDAYAIKRGEFTLASGLTTDVYFDKYQLTLPEVFDACLDQLANLVDINEFDIIAGVELGGALFAHGLARKYDKEFLAVRKEPARHGLGNRLEGYTTLGERPKSVLLVEDVITTGDTVLKAIKAIETPRDTNKHYVVCRVISIVARDIDQKITSFGKELSKQQITFHSIFQMSEFI